MKKSKKNEGDEILTLSQFHEEMFEDLSYVYMINFYEYAKSYTKGKRYYGT